jgi:hypothetical protein
MKMPKCSLNQNKTNSMRCQCPQRINLYKSVRRLNHQHIWMKSYMSPVSKALSNKGPLDTTVDFLSPATNIASNKTQRKLYNWKTEFLPCLQV